MLYSVKEKHYSPGELKSLIVPELTTFKTTTELSIKFKKSQLRISEILQELKKEGLCDYIKHKGYVYWLEKKRYEKYLLQQEINILRILEKHNGNSTAIAFELKMYRKAIPKRLEKLKTKGFVEVRNGVLKVTEKGKTLLLGVDESGRLIENSHSDQEALSSAP